MFRHRRAISAIRSVCITWVRDVNIVVENRW